MEGAELQQSITPIQPTDVPLPADEVDAQVIENDFDSSYDDDELASLANQSITTSVYRYPEENGRTYHKVGSNIAVRTTWLGTNVNVSRRLV
jgi:hypothetical protein